MAQCRQGAVAAAGTSRAQWGLAAVRSRGSRWMIRRLSSWWRSWRAVSVGG